MGGAVKFQTHIHRLFPRCTPCWSRRHIDILAAIPTRPSGYEEESKSIGGYRTLFVKVTTVNGKPQILRLDAHLNLVATTTLPEDRLPQAFIRDAQQRFWIIFQDQAGLYLFDDDGHLLDGVAEHSSGEAAVLQPSLIAASPTRVAVWEAVGRTIYLFHLSGQLVKRIPVQWERPVQAMIWAGRVLVLTTGSELLQIDPWDGRTTVLPHSGGIIDLAFRSPALYGLDITGNLREFLSVP